jgi:hypothetical protein
MKTARLPLRRLLPCLLLLAACTKEQPQPTPVATAPPPPPKLSAYDQCTAEVDQALPSNGSGNMGERGRMFQRCMAVKIASRTAAEP